MSTNNTIFLFEDRLEKVYKIYKLKQNKDDQEFCFIFLKKLEFNEKTVNLFRPFELLGQKFENINQPTSADLDKFWHMVNKTKYVERIIYDDGTVLINIDI